jgi:hypothetical protein
MPGSDDRPLRILTRNVARRVSALEAEVISVDRRYDGA